MVFFVNTAPGTDCIFYRVYLYTLCVKYWSQGSCSLFVIHICVCRILLFLFYYFCSLFMAHMWLKKIWLHYIRSCGTEMFDENWVLIFYKNWFKYSNFRNIFSRCYYGKITQFNRVVINITLFLNTRFYRSSKQRFYTTGISQVLKKIET